MKDEQLTLRPDTSGEFNQEARKVHFDPEAYAHHIAELDLTEAQQLAVMRTVWDLMVLFVDAGFGIDAPTLSGANNATACAALPDPAALENPKEVAP
ncbi:hypothetical protein [Hyphomonas sp.]|uniref:hypothetical protein n=1 Tax=Hyphomonas sp. TaxID=87 RepID=UPI002608271A|nr:hypothetical protein [Hyphomonas sp.]MDF1807762.1 hypothetical protein [Hyphomonas sp.]